jgi:hypothetical protein
MRTLAECLLNPQTYDLSNSGLRLIIELNTMDNLSQGTKTVLTILIQHLHLKISTRIIKSKQRLINSLKSVVQLKTKKEKSLLSMWHLMCIPI